MKLKIKELSIYIEDLILIVVFFCIIFEGVRNYLENYFMCYLFITFHEISHMFVASIFGIKTKRLNIRISGLNIHLNNTNRQGLKWLLIFLAGPISNIVLAVIFNKIPIVYTINLVLAIINLMPIYPLDGYNILKVLLNIIKVKKIKKVQDIIQIIVIMILGIIGIYQMFFLNNPSIILMIIYIIIQSSSPRKQRGLGMYQKYYKNITNF